MDIYSRESFVSLFLCNVTNHRACMVDCRSLGLAVVPRIRFLEKKKKQLSAKAANASDNNRKISPATVTSRDVSDSLLKDSADESSSDDDDSSPGASTSSSDSDAPGGTIEPASSDDNDDPLFTVKRSAFSELEKRTTPSQPQPLEKESRGKKKATKAALAKKLLNKKIVVNEKKVFDDDGNVRAGFVSFMIVVVYEECAIFQSIKSCLSMALFLVHTAYCVIKARCNGNYLVLLVFTH